SRRCCRGSTHGRTTGASKRSGCTGTSSIWCGSSCSRSYTCSERAHGDDPAQAAELHADLAVPVRSDGGRGPVRLRDAHFTAGEDRVPARAGGREGAARRLVLHAPEVRAVAVARRVHAPAAAGRDPAAGGHHGEALVAFLE